MAQKTRVLLTGAGTELGRSILKSLLTQKASFDITAFDYKKGKTMTFLEHFKTEVRVIYGDISDPEDSVEISRDQEFVIHCGYLAPDSCEDNPRLAQKVNVLGTRFLIENLEHYSPNCYFTSVTSVGVYGDRLRRPMIAAGDMTSPSIGDIHSLTMLQAEKLIQDSRLEWTLFRPGLILNAEEPSLGSSIFKMPLASHLEFVHIEDLAYAIVSSYERRAMLWNRVFNVGGGEGCRAIYSDFIQRLVEIAGWGTIDFPEHTFATYNRYGGFFSDGDALEELLHFRTRTLEDFYGEVQASKSLLGRLTTKIFGDIQKKSFLAQSEPYKAFKQSESDKRHLFF